MPTMAKKKDTNPVAPDGDTPEGWAARIVAWQEASGHTNEKMAELFGIRPRTYLSWKYGERVPNETAVRLFLLLSKP